MISRFPTLLILTALSFQSCTYRPVIDTQGNVSAHLPGKMIRNHGIRSFNRIKRNKVISRDPQFIAPVLRVSKRLQKVINIPEAEWEFVIFEDSSPNAFALPGGKVGINTGLFRICDNDALLAAVLGHEISHVTANHSRKRMFRALGLVLLGGGLWQTLDHNDVDHPDMAIMAFGVGSYFLDSLPFSRKQEYESDRIGAVYMAKAGYDPRKSITLWRRLKKYHALQGRKKPEFFCTHPHDDSRISALEEFMPTAMKFYWKKRNNH